MGRQVLGITKMARSFNWQVVYIGGVMTSCLIDAGSQVITLSEKYFKDYFVMNGLKIQQPVQRFKLVVYQHHTLGLLK